VGGDFDAAGTGVDLDVVAARLKVAKVGHGAAVWVGGQVKRRLTRSTAALVVRLQTKAPVALKTLLDLMAVLQKLQKAACRGESGWERRNSSVTVTFFNVCLSK
jgi:hypothetical protein